EVGILLEGGEGLVRDFGLEEAQPSQVLFLERRHLIKDVLLEQAAYAGRLNLQRERERARDCLASRLGALRDRGTASPGQPDLAVFPAAGLKPGDAGKVAPGHLVGE